jgi:pimeloyl-ACP methyl ester carboxylesterase
LVTAVDSPARAAEKAEKALKDIYFVSGLGADERVFRLLKFEGYQPVHIHWVKPERNEPIDHYAQRLATQIKSDEPIIVGLSFGGLIAIEIAKQIHPQTVILISSAKTRAEIPPYFKMFRWLPLHRIIPFKALLGLTYWLVSWFFSLESRDEWQFLRAILVDTDPHFLHWALHKVVTWKNQTCLDCLYHMHGTGDRIFPIRYVDPDYTLDKGGHFMIVNRAAKISTLIEQIIETQAQSEEKDKRLSHTAEL